jgi:uncharacterized protein YidB (DUF937 family)
MFGDVLGSVLSGALSGQQGAQGGLGSVLGSALGGSQRAGSGGLGEILGAMLGGSHQPPAQQGGLGANVGLLAALLPLALQLIQSQGGLAGLAAKFQNAGMGEHVKSWVGTEANQAISGEHVTQAMGGDTLEQLAQQLGLPQEQVSNGLAEVLPEIVNQMTPQGRMPDNQQQMLDQGFAALSRMLA